MNKTSQNSKLIALYSYSFHTNKDNRQELRDENISNILKFVVCFPSLIEDELVMQPFQG